MKYSLVAVAALVSSVAARAGHSHHHRRHAHPLNSTQEECAPPLVPKPCTTYVTSYLVPYTPPAPQPTIEAAPSIPPPAPEAPTTSDVVYVTKEVLPTPDVTTLPTPGTYTIPAKTLTLTNTEYICVPTSTQLPPGTHTYGGITTVVETQTTIVCPVPTVVTEGDVTTSKVVTTTFVCPTPGTYTIAPITTTITEVADCPYPEITEYPPGTYTQPAFTTTITKTHQVVTCPAYQTSTAYVVPVAQPTSAPEAPKPEAPKPEAPKPEATKPASTSAPKPVETKVVDVKPHAGELWAITYSQYNDNQLCKEAAAVDADIKDIASKGFKAIRLYSSDCNSLQTVGNACLKYGLHIIAGVFIKPGQNCQADSQIADWIKWGHLDQVDLFTVANEAIFQGSCTPEALVAYINKAKGQLRAAGFDGPITTAEPLNILTQHAKLLCPVLDVVGCNMHPFFNPNVSAEEAGDFINAQLADAEKLCGKPVYILETGWPSGGQSNGKAIASPDAQAKAIASITNKCPIGKVVMFTYRNDFWKDPGPLGVEQLFGCGKYF